MERSNIILILFIIILEHCNYNKFKYYTEANKIVKKEFYNQGKLSSEQQFNLDTVPDGYRKEFYSDGTIRSMMFYNAGKLNGEMKLFSAENKLKLVKEYKEGFQEGLEKAFYPSGKIEHEIYYKKDHPDSISNYYYEGGQLKSKYCLDKGSYTGQQLDFDEKGQLSNFSFYNIFGEKLCNIKYNSQGEVQEVNGAPVFVYYSTDSVKCNEYLEALIYYALPKNFKWKLYLKDYNNPFPYSENAVPRYYGYVTLLKKKFSKRGNYQIQFISDLTDSISSKKYTSNFSQNLNVF